MSLVLVGGSAGAAWRSLTICFAAQRHRIAPAPAPALMLRLPHLESTVATICTELDERFGAFKRRAVYPRFGLSAAQHQRIALAPASA